MGCNVRQLIFPGDIADRIDTRNGRLHPLVYTDPVSGDLDTDRLQADITDDRPPANSYQHNIRRSVHLAPRSIDLHHHALFASVHRGYPTIEMEGYPLARKALAQFRSDLGIGQRQDLRHHFDDHCRRAEGVVDEGKLQSDRARPDDDELFGNLGGCERFIAGPDTFACKARYGRYDRFGARRDDHGSPVP